MGFSFRDLGRAIDPVGSYIADEVRGESEDQAQDAVNQGKKAADLKREQFNLLREDAQPLRELRNENINRLLRLQGIGQKQDISEFSKSPEFMTVRDAALQVQGSNSNQDRELAERAAQLGMGEFGNFQNRIFNTAGFSSDGLNNTNRLLQENVDAQVNVLNNAGSQAAGGLISGANQRGQAASGILGMVGAFCDARLKTNIRKVGDYRSGLGKYAWDWTEEAKELVGGQPASGPMAHEVFKAQPDNITEVNGYLVIKDMRLIH